MTSAQPRPPPTVHLLCGFNGAGKSTYARHLAAEVPAVRLSLDAWMRRAFPELDLADEAYGARVPAAKAALWSVAEQVLAAGVDVVLDWNQWSRQRRAQWRDAALAAGATSVLHHLRASVEVSVERAAARASTGDAESHHLTERGIRDLAAIFEPPGSDEGLRVIVVA